MFSFTLVVAA